MIYTFESKNAIVGTFTITDKDGALTDADAGTVSFTVYDSDKEELSTTASVTHESTGVYSYIYDIPQDTGRTTYYAEMSAEIDGHPVTVRERFTVCFDV